MTESYTVPHDCFRLIARNDKSALHDESGVARRDEATPTAAIDFTTALPVIDLKKTAITVRSDTVGASGSVGGTGVVPPAGAGVGVVGVGVGGGVGVCVGVGVGVGSGVGVGVGVGTGVGSGDGGGSGVGDGGGRKSMGVTPGEGGGTITYVIGLLVVSLLESSTT